MKEIYVHLDLYFHDYYLHVIGSPAPPFDLIIDINDLAINKVNT